MPWASTIQHSHNLSIMSLTHEHIIDCKREAFYSHVSLSLTFSNDGVKTAEWRWMVGTLNAMTRCSSAWLAGLIWQWANPYLGTIIVFITAIITYIPRAINQGCVGERLSHTSEDMHTYCVVCSSLAYKTCILTCATEYANSITIGK